MTYTKALITIFVGIILWGCASVPQPAYPPIGFTDRPALRFSVAAVELVETFRASGKAPNVEHLFPVTPAATAARWANDRLAPAGGSARLKVTVKDASVIETDLRPSTGLKSLLTDQQARRYDATMTILLEVSEDAAVRAFAEVTVKRSRTAPESLTLNERDQLFYEMMRALALEFDTRMEAQIKRFLSGYLL